MDQFQKLKLVFSTIYGKVSKCDQTAETLFEDIVTFLKNDKQFFKKDKQRQMLLSLLTKATNQSEEGTVKLIFKCEYCCSIVLRKPKKQSPIDLFIISPEKWSSGTDDWQKGNFDFCEPDDSTSIHLPQVAQHEKSLNTFYKAFKNNLNSALAQEQAQAQKRQELWQYTASTIEKACKIAAVQSKYSMIYDNMLDDSKQNQTQKKSMIKKSAQGIALNDSQANTTWYIPANTVNKLISYSKKYKIYSKKLIIGFKAHLLQKVTRQKAEQKSYDQKEVTQFKKCLDDLIFMYKSHISIHESEVNRVKDFMKVINKIQDNLKVITNGGLTSRINDVDEKKGDLKFQEPKQASIVKIDKIKHQKEPLVLADISDYPLGVDLRFPFQDLLQLAKGLEDKSLAQKGKWVLLTERTFFELTQKFTNSKEIIDLNIHMRQIQCRIGSTTLCSLVDKYEKIVTKDLLHFGMGMVGQAKSHIQLIKTIAAIVAFQSVKLNRDRLKSNLKNYRIPIDLSLFHTAFISHSYQARRAMRNLLIYNQSRQKKNEIFKLNGQSSSFKVFAQLVARQTRSTYVWKEKMQRIQLLSRELTCQSLRTKYTQEKLNKAIASFRSHTENSNRYGVYGGYSIQNEIKNINNLNSIIYSQNVLTQYNSQNPWLHAFLENIPPDVLGLLKIVMITQNPIIEEKVPTNNLFVNTLSHEQFPITIHSDKPKTQTRTLYSQEISVQKILVSRHFNDVKIMFNNASYGTQMDKNTFQSYRKLFHTKQENQQYGTKFNYILSPPLDSTVRDREHRLYARQDEKPDEIQTQDFLAIGNVRSANNTQLMVLCKNILQKKIVSNSYEKRCLLAEQVILQTAGQLSTYNPQIQRKFSQIRSLLINFIDAWAFTDTNFCPILGPFLGYIGRQIIDDEIFENDEQKQDIRKVVIDLSKKCIQEYERGVSQLGINPNLKIQWDQRFVLTAAICCFREIVLQEGEEEQIKILCQLIFLLRSSKILSDREPKRKMKPKHQIEQTQQAKIKQQIDEKRQFEKQLIFSIEKSIFYNINVISSYLQQNPKCIGDIVRKIDLGYEDKIQWKKNNISSFEGRDPNDEHSDIYQLDLFNGKIFKNGKQISALDPKIKENPYFKEIFGQQRQFQVYQSHQPHFLRTKDHVNCQFKIDQDESKVFFEFAEDGTEIRHIIKVKDCSNSDEDVWVLIPRQKLLSSNILIPKLFMETYLAWYSQKRKCIAFRYHKFEKIYIIGMVVHLQTLQPEMKIERAFYITYHGNYEDQDMNKICDKSTTLYDEIILRDKSVGLEKIKCFKILSKFQKPSYIFELKNRKTGDVEYLLHRYQMKFKLEGQTRLASETYFGYSLDHSFYDDKNSLFNRFPCLVLQKYSKNPTLLNNHKRILIISDGDVKYGGQIITSRKADIHIDSFKFEIHDFFGDLRGSTRESLIQLSSLMLSINDNIKIKSIEMTPLDYSMYLLKCCLSNRPLNQFENKKINHIVQNLNPPESIVLLCESLWVCSHKLQRILSFSNQKTFYSIFSFSKTQQLMTCRTIYENKWKDEMVRYRQKISLQLLNIISVPIKDDQKSRQSSQSESSSSSQSGSESSEQERKAKKREFKDEFYWKSLRKFTGERFLPQIQQIRKLFQQFDKTSTSITTIWKQQPQQPNTKIKISAKIYQLSSNPQCNQMTKQIIQQLQSSYNQFIIDNNKNQLITKKLQQGLKKVQLQLIEKIKKIGQNVVNSIQSLVENIKKKIQQHPDVLTGVIPTFSFICFTGLICNREMIKHYFPHFGEKVKNDLWEIMKIWSEMKTRMASFDRMKVILEAETLDTVSLMRQALSPRNQVREKPYWLCFQTQNKVQLWSSQLDTYLNLTEQSKNPGNFCQLNMGQGKTQVIIPMIILDAIYNQQKAKGIPRINLLYSLIDEARGNFFRFLSVTGFQIAGFQIPFTRKVDLSKENIYQIRGLIDSFSKNIFILMTRESRLSEILRYYQISKFNKAILMEKQPLIPGKIYDIFDEIDALMTPLKSYIFSIGETQSLPSSKVRFQILRVLIQILLLKHLPKLIDSGIASSQQTRDQTMRLVQQGRYPPGLRINLNDLSEQQIKKIRKQIACDLIKQLQNTHFSFFKYLNTQFQENLVEYIINPLDSRLHLPKETNLAWKDQIFILRGAFGYGIFQHCLTMRCGVDYGAPNQHHKKKIAVPYEAADIPSKTSQYQHPDVSIILSYLAYYTKGLKRQQFQQALQHLLKLSKTSKSNQYDQWFQSLPQPSQLQLKIKNAQQINKNSRAVIEQLYEFFGTNRRTIAFWLNKCIFPTNLRQYKQSITASAWDLADVEESVGFSGTKDNHWLYSDRLTWKPCQIPAIKGTDGKMIHLITKFTTKICLIKQSDTSQWERFVDTALRENVDCIIDAGALCVGKSLEKQIVPWIAEHEMFDTSKYVGISFCDQNGKWKVYDVELKHYIPRGSSIPDHETFVIFDQARTRGADLKMNPDVTAAISLGPQMTKDKFMQAAGRLRRLGRNQKLIMMATHQIFSELKQLKNVKTEEDLQQKILNFNKEQLTNIILAWTVKNSIQLNEKLLVQFGTLGWSHIRSKTDKQVHIKQIKSELNNMYEHGLQKTTVAILNQKIEQSLNRQYTATQSGKHIRDVLGRYGKKVYRQASNLDDVCERQVQPEPEVAKEQQDKLRNLNPIPEKDETLTAQRIPEIPIVFDSKFLISQNFINTTNCYEKDLSMEKKNTLELSDVYFLQYNERSITLITLRETSRRIEEGLNDGKLLQRQLDLLDNLSIDDEFIENNNLEGALVSAKLLSGVENYSYEEENFLLKIFFNSTKEMKASEQKYEMLTEFILRKKRNYLKKYAGSTLDKLVVRLNNEAMNSAENKQSKVAVKSIKKEETQIFKLQWKRPNI